MIAGKRRGVGSGGDFCARGARRLHAGKRMIALNGRGIARTGFRTLISARSWARRLGATLGDRSCTSSEIEGDRAEKADRAMRLRVPAT